MIMPWNLKAHALLGLGIAFGMSLPAVCGVCHHICTHMPKDVDPITGSQRPLKSLDKPGIDP